MNKGGTLFEQSGGEQSLRLQALDLNRKMEEVVRGNLREEERDGSETGERVG